MKTRIAMLLVLLLLCPLGLWGCKRGGAGTPGLLAYPGTNWNMTVDEVRTAMGIPLETELSGGKLVLEHVRAFGAEAEKLVFGFSPDGAGILRLAAVEITYPDDADMAAIRAALGSAYGPEVDTYTECQTRPFSAAPSLSSIGEMKLTNPRVYQRELESGEHFAMWCSAQDVESYSLAPVSPLREDWQEVLDNFLRQDNKMDAKGAWYNYNRHQSVVRLSWTDNGEQMNTSKKAEPGNRVIFDARVLHTMRDQPLEG